MTDNTRMTRPPTATAPRRRTGPLLALAALLLALAHGAAQAAGSPAVSSASDGAVKDAAEAYRFGEPKRLSTALSQVRGHVLERYVEYWALRLRIDIADAAEVERFLRVTQGTAIGERMRTDWLKQLGKSGDWVRFAQVERDFVTEDSEIACYRTTFAGRTGAALPVDVPRGVWEERLTEACADASAALVRQQRVSADDAAWRFRSSADGGTLLAASRVAEALGDAVAPSAAALQRAYSNPEAYLRALLPQPARAEREAALFALTRWARSDVAKARAAWPALAPRFSSDEQRYVALQLADKSARRLDVAEALHWARAAQLDGSYPRLGDWQAAWIARVALRAGEWQEVSRAVAAMSAATSGGRNDPAWRYWHARALAAGGDRAAAQAIYSPLAGDLGYYGLLAAEELGRPLPPAAALKSGTLPAGSETMREAVFRRLDRSDAARRVLKLSELGLRADAAREWLSVVKDLDDVETLAAAEWMRRKGVWDRSINTAERTRTLHDMSLRFQTPYGDEIRKAATQASLDHALLFGLVRQESRFWAEAISSAGAMGLMQVMPATAKWIAAKIKAGDFRPSHLLDAGTNAGFGAFYLRTVLDQLGGSEPMAAAAYNAGPGRARAWRGDTPLEGAIYAESIPFNETRDYVKKVLANAVWYAHLQGSGDTSLKSRLGTVPARQGRKTNDE
ncbi:MAG: lytic transglycosylase domain-containing protein [Burkholderiales bacterium]|nr:lytic transglycosylase domain-containing protein [Burkholderiales bacterium]